MESNNTDNVYDALVIGSGLAGLITGLNLQRGGKRVLIIDKREQVGGLCGTFWLNDHEFVIGCNDFGSGLVDMLNQLDVNVEFEYKKSLVYYEGDFFNSSPDLNTFWKLRRYWRSILKGIFAIFRRMLSRSEPVSLETFADQHFPPGPVNDMAKLFSYFMGVPPYDMQTSFFGLDKKYAYGYVKMACPVGGPQKMADAIAERFVHEGGCIHLNTTYQRYSHDNVFEVEVIDEEEKINTFKTDYLINTIEQGKGYASNIKRGIPLSMMTMVVDDAYEYPCNVHTFSYFEPGISDWFMKLDHGEAPERYGFHVFKSDIKQNAPGYTMNAFFYLPRGKNTLSAPEKASYQEYLLSCIEEMLPGIRKAIRFTQIISPAEYVNMFGLSSRVMPFVFHGSKPSNVGDEPGLFYAGHTVYPPGDHAGAAALSGQLVAKRILEM